MTRLSHRYPVYIVADEDHDACDRMIGMCPADYFYIPVRTGHDALRYYKDFQEGTGVAGVLLADSVRCAGAGAEKALARLVEERARVVVLSELPNDATVARWKERGAVNCIAHPTRTSRRMSALRNALQTLMEAELEGLERGPGTLERGDE